MKSAKTTAPSMQKLPDNTASKLNRIHHDLNHISGGLIYRITKHRLSREETQGWITTLRRLADDLESIIS